MGIGMGTGMDTDDFNDLMGVWSNDTRDSRSGGSRSNISMIFQPLCFLRAKSIW
jgi:hypothetical protein